MLSSHALALVGQLHGEHQRADIARALAVELGAEELIIFTPDPELGVFLENCTREHRHAGSLFLDGQVRPAHGVAAADGAVLVLIGGTPRDELLGDVLLLFPLLSAAFARERAMIAASGHAAAARQAAESAGRLAAALDTVRRDLQAALTQAQQAIRERDLFVSIAAHELNTPLTSLKAIAQLNRRRLQRMSTVDPAWVSETLDRIDEQASKVTRLVRQLLDISRLESGQLPLTPIETDVVALVRGAVELAQAQTQRHTMRIDAPSTLIARVDGLRLEQVLTNLLDNALRYSPDGGLIEVRVRPHGERFDIIVLDEGPGIPEAQHEQIFDRFHRAAPSDNSAGLGIGLFVSREIVELHGGRITAANRKDRSGALFTVVLPLMPVDGVSKGLAREAAPASVTAEAGREARP